MSTNHSHASKLLIALPFFLALAVIAVVARPGGINGYSGNPDTNQGGICTECHSGGVVPAVTLSGPTSVQAGSTNSYRLTVSGGQEIAGGLDVSATDGTFVIVDAGTYLRSGEVTHSQPRNVGGGGSVSWDFDWTAPAGATTVTMYGAGNSVNLADGRRGDNANSDTLTIDVSGGGAPGPGESSGPAENPLLVTGYDRATGNISISFGTACETVSNNVYFGPLDQVSAYGWSGEDCDIGLGPGYGSLNPGSGSFFFVVVGTNGSDEGSYGKDRLVSGMENERPPFTGNACGQAWNLADRCD